METPAVRSDQEVYEELKAEFSQLQKKFGVTRFEDLDPKNSEVNAVAQRFYAWCESSGQKIAKNPNSPESVKLNHLMTTFYVEAGFHDPDYLDEVAHDFLPQDLERAEATNEDGSLDSVIKEIQASIAKIEGMLEAA